MRFIVILLLLPLFFLYACETKQDHSLGQNGEGYQGDDPTGSRLRYYSFHSDYTCQDPGTGEKKTSYKYMIVELNNEYELFPDRCSIEPSLVIDSSDFEEQVFDTNGSLLEFTYQGEYFKKSL
jgi:hypothetical protein